MSIRNVLITGASSGIGEAITDKLLSHGHTVYGLARRKMIRKNPRFQSFSIDLLDLDSLPEKLTPFAHVDTIICSAGKGCFGHLEQLGLSEIRSLMDLNFISHVIIIKTLLPFLKKKPFSDIIFMGSEASLAGKKRGSIYCASKFALRGFAQSLREECSQSSIRISTLLPGMVRTPFFDTLDFMPGDDSSHAILPEDIAKIILTILDMRAETFLDEIILSPKKRVIKKNLYKL